MRVVHAMDPAARVVALRWTLDAADSAAAAGTADLTEGVPLRIRVPALVRRFEDVHGDLWALALLLVFAPHVRPPAGSGQLRLSWGVSRLFAQACAAALGVAVAPVAGAVAPRAATCGGNAAAAREAVAYLGLPACDRAARAAGPHALVVALDELACLERHEHALPGDALYADLDRLEVDQGRAVALVQCNLWRLFRRGSRAPPPLAHVFPCVVLAGVCAIHRVRAEPVAYEDTSTEDTTPEDTTPEDTADHDNDESDSVPADTWHQVFATVAIALQVASVARARGGDGGGGGGRCLKAICAYRRERCDCRTCSNAKT
jgi:hypothetical protein